MAHDRKRSQRLRADRNTHACGGSSCVRVALGRRSHKSTDDTVRPLLANRATIAIGADVRAIRDDVSRAALGIRAIVVTLKHLSSWNSLELRLDNTTLRKAVAQASSQRVDEILMRMLWV